MTASPRTAKTIEYTKAARALRAHADPEKAKVYRCCFKHVDDDVFLTLRRLAREFYQLSLADVRKLMWSAVHEKRSLACAIDNSRSFA